MSRSLKDKIFLLGRYFDFTLHAKSRYAVHSPYLYKMVEQVIRPGSPEALCGPVEELRKRLLGKKGIIQKTDYGSGGGKEKPSVYPVRVSALAKSSSLPTRRAARLFNLVRFLEAGNILELGTSLGISTAYMAKANAIARIVTLEGCPKVAEIARKNFKELSLDNVRIIQGPFSDKLPEALDYIQKADLIFMDGDHRGEATLEYFRRCLPYTHPETVVVIDDIHYSPGMEKAWDAIAGSPEVTVSIDLFYQGWLLMKKELSPQRFMLRYP